MGIKYISLQESAESLGFSSIDEALEAGYEACDVDDPDKAHFVKKGESNVQTKYR